MKGVRLSAPAGLDKLAMVEMPDPGHPGPGQIRVKVSASSLNFHDYIVCSGRTKTADGRIPLSDAGGVVEAVGAGVSEFAAGDVVVSAFFPGWQDGPAENRGFSTTPGDGADGYAREAVVTPTAYFTKAPEGWTPAQAATLTTAGTTAWRALVVEGQIKAGDTVLALGTGGVSVFALQLAKAMGATVIITSSSDAKLERCKAMGADHTLNYKETPEWGAAVTELTGGKGVDHVLEVGGPKTIAQSIEAARSGGRIHLIGALGGWAGDVPAHLILLKQLRLQGLLVGSRRHQQDFVKAIDVIGMTPVIDSAFPLEDLAGAFNHELAGGHFGKIGVEI